MQGLRELAQVLGGCWAEQMFLMLEARAIRVPRRWPGSKDEARRLASAYAETTGETELLASALQKAAADAWVLLVAFAAETWSDLPPVRARAISGWS